MLRKDFWGLSNTINLFFEKDIGHNAATGTQFLWAWETRVDALTMRFGDHFVVEPGFQYYSQPGKIGHFSNWNDQDNRIGPQLFGKVFDIGPGTLEWNAGFPGRPDQFVCRSSRRGGSSNTKSTIESGLAHPVVWPQNVMGFLTRQRPPDIGDGSSQPGFCHAGNRR